MLDTRFIDLIYVVLCLLLLFLLIFLLLKSDSIIVSILITLSFVPTFSPVFWFAHLVYFIPVMFYLLIVNLSWDQVLKNSVSAILLLIYVLIFILVQPNILGGYLVDQLIIYGFYYGFSIVCIVNFLFNNDRKFGFIE